MCSLGLGASREKGHIMTDTHVDVQIISFICFVWVSPGNQQLEDTYVDGKPQIVICLICFMKVLTEKKTTERLYLCFHPKEDTGIVTQEMLNNWFW